MIQNAAAWDQPMFCFDFFPQSFAKTEHWIASHCISMYIMGNPPISICSVMVFLFTLTFLWFQRKSYISFLMFWIMSAAGYSTYARYQILLIMTWFINIFFPMSNSCKCPHFCLSSRILFFTFPQFCSRVWLFLLPTRISYNSKTLIDNIFCNITNPLVKSAMSRNISSSLSDHRPQFFILPEFFSNFSPTKNNIIFNDWKNFNNQSFLEDFEKN